MHIHTLNRLSWWRGHKDAIKSPQRCQAKVKQNGVETKVVNYGISAAGTLKGVGNTVLRFTNFSGVALTSEIIQVKEKPPYLSRNLFCMYFCVFWKPIMNWNRMRGFYCTHAALWHVQLAFYVLRLPSTSGWPTDELPVSHKVPDFSYWN